jgi:pimeloyl-ACP methyl ester carboxylesterase
MILPPPGPPSAWLLAIEGARAAFEWSTLALSWPMLGSAPRGDGHPVLVFPGLIANDATTWPLRRFLERQNYAVQPWGMGFNRGPRDGLLEKLVENIQSLHQRYGTKVSLVGWSLGGVIARVLAAQLPEHVRNVVTLGSPHGGDPKASHAWRVFESVSGFKVDDPALQGLLHSKPQMPMTSLLSKSDGVVNWQLSLLPDSPMTENIEVLASHLGMGANPAVLWALADRLAQPEGHWQPLTRDGWKLMFYGRPRQGQG